jgi:cysteine sulfinate desulfinase/cysteine desulfurase-like protein
VNRETFFDYASGNPFFKIDLKEIENLGNPSASYFAVSDLVGMIRDTKELIKELFGCDNEDEIIFTSGASESNSLALQEPFECSIYNHASIKENPNRIDYSPYKAVTLVDSELGKRHNVRNATHIDATQGVDLFINKAYAFKDLKANTLSFSGYKIGALQGIGVLIVKKDYFKKLKPIIMENNKMG